MFERLCHGCLNSNRNVFPLLDVHLYYTLLHDERNDGDMKYPSIQLCFECEAILRKVRKFQKQIRHAQMYLVQQLYGNNLNKGIQSLSSLVVIQTKIDTDYNFNYEEAIELKEDVKLICDIEVDDRCSTPEVKNDDRDLNVEVIEVKTEPKVKTKKSKWAIKRAKENKKPKFKILSLEYSLMYERVKASEKEIYDILKKKEDRDINKLPYQCKMCNYGFAKENDFVEHNKKVHAQKTEEFICNVCRRSFNTKNLLTKHIKSHDCMYKCKMCNYESWSRVKIEHHIKKEHNKPIQCLKCELRFRNRTDFRTHYKLWHENYICDHCRVSFKMRYSIKEHLRTQHSPYICKPCNRSFSRYNGLWLHNKVQHSPSLKPAYCVECDKSFRNAYTYRWHLANSVRHNAKTKVSVPCPGCAKVFTKRIYMKDHYDLVHLKIYKYRCAPCDKNFTRNAELVKHVRAVHECIPKDKNKICYVCGRGFSSNEILANHLRVHTGERPFECPQCSSKFTQRASVASHLRTVHADRNRTTKK